MKRSAAFILTLLYFVTSTGATMNYHFCMGEMANISILGNGDKNCGKCGMEKHPARDNGCCKDETKWLKIEDDHKTSPAHFQVPKLPLETISAILFFNDLFASQQVCAIPESKAPLRSFEIETYLLNCVFRI